MGSSCNNEMEAALCAASETRCSPSESGSTKGCSSCFGRTLGRLAQREGKERCIKMNYYVAIYSVPRVLHACYSVRDVSDAESRGPSGPRSEVRSPECLGIDSSIAGIDTLHRSVGCLRHWSSNTHFVINWMIKVFNHEMKDSTLKASALNF